MSTDIALTVIAAALLALYQWLFRILPRERWQVLAVIPVRRQGGHWHGSNLTYYGLITGIAGSTGAALFLFLSAATGVDPITAVGILLGLLALCLPAAKLIARLVEKNPHGFTVGGASFVGVMVAPPLLALINNSLLPDSIPVIALLAAIAIAYTLGEGIGRLACLSFGCCYGKPVQQTAPWIQRQCQHWPHRYQGKLKKIAFAGNMEGVAVIPVQALSCVVLTLLALAATSLFLHGWHGGALLLSLVGSQLWRLWSETLRADYRGGSAEVSTYQVMAMISCVYISAVVLLMPDTTATATDVGLGLAALWQPGTLLLLQGIGAGMFLYTGTSTITRARLQMQLADDWQGAHCSTEEKGKPARSASSADAAM